MKVFAIHWKYDTSSDDQLYYTGKDDKVLFHKECNAKEYATSLLKMYNKDRERLIFLCDKHYKEELLQEEKREYYELIGCENNPISFTIYEKELIFGD